MVTSGERNELDLEELKREAREIVENRRFVSVCHSLSVVVEIDVDGGKVVCVWVDVDSLCQTHVEDLTREVVDDRRASRARELLKRAPWPDGWIWFGLEGDPIQATEKQRLEAEKREGDGRFVSLDGQVMVDVAMDLEEGIIQYVTVLTDTRNGAWEDDPKRIRTLDPDVAWAMEIAENEPWPTTWLLKEAAR